MPVIGLFPQTELELEQLFASVAVGPPAQVTQERVTAHPGLVIDPSDQKRKPRQPLASVEVIVPGEVVPHTLPGTSGLF